MPDSTPMHGTVVSADFKPHPLLANPHVQTIGPAMLRRTPPVEFSLETLDLPDDDFIVIGHAGEPPPERMADPTVPRLVMLHGLTGSLESKYLRGLTRRMRRRGWHCIAVQQRGAGLTPNRLARSYNHGASDDIRWVLQTLRQRWPEAPMATVGWSLGGNVLLKMLGETGRESGVDAAIAVSVPFQLEPCVEHLQRGFARIYQWRLMSALKTSLRTKHGPVPLPPDADLPAALLARNFRDFDNAYTAACNDYEDAADYYARAACGRYLCDIQTQTRIIHSADDPFMSPEIVPGAEALSPSVTLELSPLGGHVGFIEAGRRGRPALWLERVIPDRIESMLGDRLPERVKAARQTADEEEDAASEAEIELTTQPLRTGSHIASP